MVYQLEGPCPWPSTQPCGPWPEPCPVEPYLGPLPISTGANGIDRCGNLHVYAAPRTVWRPVHWEHWPIPYQGWLSFPGGYSYPRGMFNQLSQLMAGGAAVANWMICAQKPPAPG